MTNLVCSFTSTGCILTLGKELTICHALKYPQYLSLMLIAVMFE